MFSAIDLRSLKSQNTHQCSVLFVLSSFTKETNTDSAVHTGSKADKLVQDLGFPACRRLSIAFSFPSQGSSIRVNLIALSQDHLSSHSCNLWIFLIIVSLSLYSQRQQRLLVTQGSTMQFMLNHIIQSTQFFIFSSVALKVKERCRCSRDIRIITAPKQVDT